MIIAQLQRKLPEQFEEMEDVLTSSVFSLFKYLNAEAASLLLSSVLGTDMSSVSMRLAFWPRYPTPSGFGGGAAQKSDFDQRGQTEPDVVIETDDVLIFVEGKFRSYLDDQFDQLGREFVIGHRLAQDLGKRFLLLAVTRDILQPQPKDTDLYDGIEAKIRSVAVSGSWKDGSEVEAAVRSSFKWINWQRIWSCLKSCNAGNLAPLVDDVCALLLLHNLTPYDSSPLRKLLGVDLPLAALDFDYSYTTPSAYRKKWQKIWRMDLSLLEKPVFQASLRKQFDLRQLSFFDLSSLGGFTFDGSRYIFKTS
jgi:hypothetical protein